MPLFNGVQRGSDGWKALARSVLPESCTHLEYDIRKVLAGEYKPHINWALTVHEGNSLTGLALLSIHHCYNTSNEKTKAKVVKTTDNIVILEYLCGVRRGGSLSLDLMDRWLPNVFGGEQFVIQTCSVFESCSYYVRQGFRLGIYPQIPLVDVAVPDIRINGRIQAALYHSGTSDPGLTPGDQQQLPRVIEFIKGMNMAGSIRSNQHRAHDRI